MTSLGLLQYSEINDNSAINSNMTELEKKKQLDTTSVLYTTLQTLQRSTNL